ncbi:Non-hem dioxygenase N-terminal domain - like 3 [Theobroma cacao]|nr:Non-hem dioxygenase N-terminal domain - like 3 [Theobroma cacao]
MEKLKSEPQDFSLLAKGDGDERRKLDLARKEWGFFQITNHGVADEVLHKMKSAVAAFFALPLEEKKMYAMAENDLHGYGQGCVVSEQQKLDWCDMMALMTLPPESRNFKFWPLTLPGFNPHSDGGSLTLLLQDDEITGLQIRHKEEWIPVKPIPNSLVMNIGDAVEIQSNGMHKIIEHRAITNEEKPRISIATFVFPDDEQKIGPLESTIDDSHRPRMYRNIKYVDYIKEKFARRMEGKAHTDFVKLQSK